MGLCANLLMFVTIICWHTNVVDFRAHRWRRRRTDARGAPNAGGCNVKPDLFGCDDEEDMSDKVAPGRDVREKALVEVRSVLDRQCWSCTHSALVLQQPTRQSLLPVIIANFAMTAVIASCVNDCNMTSRYISYRTRYVGPIGPGSTRAQSDSATRAQLVLSPHGPNRTRVHLAQCLLSAAKHC